MAHVLEHVQDEDRLVKEISRVLKSGGQAYIEIPTPETLNYPSRQAFLAKEIDVSTINFFDDKTHLRTFDGAALHSLFTFHDFKIVEQGTIQNLYLEDELITYGIKNKDQETTTYGLWSKLKWAHYIIVEKR